MNFRSTFKTLIFCKPSDNLSFQSCLKPCRRYASCQLSELTTVVFRAIHSFYFLHLELRHRLNNTIPPHMWIRYTVRNIGSLFLSFLFHVGPPSFSLYNQSAVGVVNHSIQSYLTPGTNYASSQQSE